MASSPTTSSVESSPSSASGRRLSGDSFKSPSLKNPRTQDVFQSIVKGRKSWKTLRGGEVVWPPELEAALIEGLENYQPDDSRETRLLGRFPMRNRFISDWIFEKTSKRRTAKQVGSRLQQLRDTCGGKRLLNLLSPTRRPCRTPSLSPEFQHKDGHLTYGPPSLRYESESCSDSSASSPPTPTEAHATLQSLLYRGVEPRAEEIPDTIVYIDLLSERWPSPISSDDDDPFQGTSWTSTSDAIAEENSWLERGHKIERASQQPRHLGDIDPTITLLSKAETSAQSHFTVHTDDGVIFSETTKLEPVDPSAIPSMDGSLLYKTPLVPGFWDTIARSSDASQYVIIQHVIPDASSSAPQSTIFSAMYKFNYVIRNQSQSALPLHHTQQDQSYSSQHINMLSMDATHATNQKADYVFDSLLSIDTDNFDMMGFNKSDNLFDLGSYMRSDDWSTSSNESVFPSPVDCSRPTAYSLTSSSEVHEHQMLSSASSFPLSDVPNYAL